MSLPLYRFKEFDGEWSLHKLGNIANVITSGSRDWAKYYSESGSKFIRMTNLSRNGIQLKLDDLKYVNVESNSTDGERTSLVHGDILLSITAELGKVGWIPPNFGKAYINQHTALIRLKPTSANSIFTAHLLSTVKSNKQINGLNDAGAKAGLNLSTIKSLTVCIPELEEQTKIANFLTAVDEKITQLTQKHKLLTQYKKGVMQKIFNQELRFKGDDGSKFPEWLLQSLKEISSITMGSSPSSSSYNEDGVGLPLIQGNADINERFSAPRIFTSQITKECDEGDLLLSVRAPVGTVAVSRHNACIGRGIASIKAKDNCLQGFLYQFLMELEPKWKSLSQGSTFEAVNSDEIRNLGISLPSFKEQTKIANFLTAVDEKITNTQAELEAAKQYKQGLLQQMFV